MDFWLIKLFLFYTRSDCVATAVGRGRGRATRGRGRGSRPNGPSYAAADVEA